MPGVRANWHLPATTAVDEDPFAAPIDTIGVPIRLDGETAQLRRELVALYKREKVLLDEGTSCPVKDTDQTSCHACPIAGRHGELCRVGRRQEQLLTLSAVQAHGG